MKFTASFASFLIAGATVAFARSIPIQHVARGENAAAEALNEAQNGQPLQTVWTGVVNYHPGSSTQTERFGTCTGIPKFTDFKPDGCDSFAATTSRGFCTIPDSSCSRAKASCDKAGGKFEGFEGKCGQEPLQTVWTGVVNYHPGSSTQTERFGTCTGIPKFTDFKPDGCDSFAATTSRGFCTIPDSSCSRAKASCDKAGGKFEGFEGKCGQEPLQTVWTGVVNYHPGSSTQTERFGTCTGIAKFTDFKPDGCDSFAATTSRGFCTIPDSSCSRAKASCDKAGGKFEGFEGKCGPEPLQTVWTGVVNFHQGSSTNIKGFGSCTGIPKLQDFPARECDTLTATTSRGFCTIKSASCAKARKACQKAGGKFEGVEAICANVKPAPPKPSPPKPYTAPTTPKPPKWTGEIGFYRSQTHSQPFGICQGVKDPRRFTLDPADIAKPCSTRHIIEGSGYCWRKDESCREAERACSRFGGEFTCNVGARRPVIGYRRPSRRLW
ncbi:hypothetical protein HGRIS_005541 [Hohenbuehelia grisea]|uniref:Uncharacterized protein n=1 Tax=Hohenbuehelia grisea TaxID=104357 RepID=A0ABR3JYZ4_9AGAR